MKYFKTDSKSWIKFTGVLAIGGLIGFLYYYWFGCRQSCPLNSNPFIMTGIGLLLGGNFGIGLILKKKENSSETDNAGHQTDQT